MLISYGFFIAMVLSASGTNYDVEVNRCKTCSPSDEDNCSDAKKAKSVICEGYSAPSIFEHRWQVDVRTVENFVCASVYYRGNGSVEGGIYRGCLVRGIHPDISSVCDDIRTNRNITFCRICAEDDCNTGAVYDRANRAPIHTFVLVLVSSFVVYFKY